MLRNLVVLAVAFLQLSTPLLAQVRTEDSVRKWEADLAFFRERLIATHPEPFHSLSRESFDRMLKGLRADLPKLTDDQIVVRLSKILASLGRGDGHTGLFLAHPRFGYHFAPLGFYHFSDGIFVKSAAPEYRQALGARLLSIDAIPIEEVLPRVLEITEGDNEMSRRAWSMRALVIPEVLHALGVARSRNGAEYRLRSRDGKELTLRPKLLNFHDPVEWVTAATATPLYLRQAGMHPYNPHDLKAHFWYEYLPGERLLYVNYSAVANTAEETVAEFFRRVFAFTDSIPVDKFVLDIRLNSGGNNFLNRPILHGLIKRDETIARPGHLFVIIGRVTFSAAQNLATLLDIHTSAMFIGEPTGGSPNHFGDAVTVTLPNSGFPVRIASLRWQDSDPRDRRPWVAPEVAAELSSADYLAGRDPALEAVRGYSEQPSLATQIREALLRGEKPAALQALAEFRAAPRNKYADPQGAINRLGYELLREKKIDAAILVFEINTETFPQSWNVWDSLGEAYAAAGRRKEALRAYQRALTLNPDARSAIQALSRLKAPE